MKIVKKGRRDIPVTKTDEGDFEWDCGSVLRADKYIL